MNGKLVVWLIVALILGFVGGIVGGMVFGPKPPDTTGLARELGALQAQVQTLAGKLASLPATSAPAVKIGVVDAETLFARVFLPQVAAERSAMRAKAEAIQQLQAKYAQGQIKADAYQQQYGKLQAEYLQAQVQVNMSMLDKMIASPGFADLRTDLQNLKDQAKPLLDQMNALVRQAQVTILDFPGFFNQLQQLQSAFQQIDQLLTQVAAVKILDISQQIAREQGYDIVLRTKDVVMYQRAPAITDLSTEVEKRLANLFPSR